MKNHVKSEICSISTDLSARFSSLVIVVCLFVSVHNGYSQKTPKDSDNLIAAAPIEFSYTLPRAAQVSLVISNSSGRVVRELLHAAPRKHGANRETWDGLDENGKPVAAGDYRWKLLSTQGLKAEYLLSLGTNPTPAWAKWPGNHGAITAVAVDNEGAYFVDGCGEGTPLLVKQTLDGEKRLWVIPTWLDAWGGMSALDVMDGKLFMFTGAFIRRADAATGKVDPVKWNISWEVGKGEPGPWGQMRADMAAGAGQLVVSYANRDAIRWFDPVDGKQLDEAVVQEPLGVTVAPDGRVLIISKDTVVALSRGDKKPVTLISSGLNGAYRLTVDPKSGQILVAEGAIAGPSKQATWEGAPRQVKRFSSTGKLLATYGKKGGSTNGTYDPYAFGIMSDIAADGQGGFLIAEPDVPPRRAAHFDSEGHFVREWYGGQMYACFAAADPADPTDVWLDSTFGSIIRAKVDYTAKTWKVREIYGFSGQANGLIGNFGHGSTRWLPLRHNGQLYLERGGEVMRVDEEKKQLIPCSISKANLYVPWNSDPWGGLPEWFRDLAGNPQKPGGPKTVPYSFLWTDKNKDGIPQGDEIQFWTQAETIQLGGGGVDSDLNLYGTAVAADGHLKIFVRPVLSWTDDGVPVYSGPDKALPVTGSIEEALGVEKMAGTDNRGPANIACDEDGNIFLATNSDGDKPFGMGFWSPRVGGNRVFKWNKEGQLQWVVGHHAPGIAPKPGEAGYFWRVVGVTHGCVVVGDVENAEHVWDKDGLWVGRLLENPDLNAAPAEAYRGETENFGGSLYTDPKTGEVFYYGCTANNSPVFRITGWEQFERQGGTFSIAPEQAQRLQARAEAEDKRDDVVRIGRLPSLTLDGDLKEWSAVKPVEIKDGNDVIAKVWVAIDQKAGNLCAAFDVNTTTPWKNSSPPHLAFQGGASVSLSLGLWEPERKEVGPGDLRLVAAPAGNPGTVVNPFSTSTPAPPAGAREDHGNVGIFIPKILMGKPSAGPVYETGNGRVQLEAFNPGVGKFVVKIKPDNTGYTLEFQVPLGRLSIPIQPGLKLRLDASIGLSNDEGTKTATRIPWHSRDSSDMATADVYYESVLRPQNWGEARIDR